jgi:hypothetical protein
VSVETQLREQAKQMRQASAAARGAYTRAWRALRRLRRVLRRLARYTAENEVPSDWTVPQHHVPVLLAGNEDAEWSLAPDEVDP